MSGAFQISGEWNSTKNHCSFGYHGVWEIAENGDDIIVKERPGSYCCLFIPNCFPKKHYMKKTEENKWQGSSGCKTVSITRISDTQLEHLTTDGLCTLTRCE